MKLKQKRWNPIHIRKYAFLVTSVALLTAITVALAWFSYTRKIQTATLIDVPEIYIEGPQGEGSQLLDLGDIDLTNGTSREYVFRVVAATGIKYRLQIAYTTNVPFTYTIYPASKSGKGNNVETGGENFYYSDSLSGKSLAKDTTKDLTYGESNTNKVHADANPQYWQSVPVEQIEKYSYYVLKVSWAAGLANNKETDMVYMTVKTDVG